MRRRATALSALTALALAACSAPTEPQETLHVGAAASLHTAFEEIAADYEAEHPEVTVELQFAGSSDLAAQINGGADIDVFASADEATMDKVADSIAGEPTIFATNTLTIVTAPGNPKGIRSLADLEEVSTTVVTCAPQVPCGHATQRLTESRDVFIAAVSEESSVTGVLAKVTSGEADAGIVYVTDAADAGDEVATVPVSGAEEIVNRYPIAAMTGAPSDAAQDFIDVVTGPQGQRALTDLGFGAP